MKSEMLSNKCTPLKSPRPDGMPTVFYQKFGNIVRSNVTECVLSTLNSGIMPSETMHHINQTRKGKDGLMAIKLNMSKAFDRVEWPCLERIMRKLGFHDRWISLMMMCIITVSYLVLLNGEPRGMIRPTRGIWQGDPISPYLFLLCTEGLSTMLKKEELQGHIKGVSICRRAPPISHLLFANDSLIFYKANMSECNKVWKVLKDYEAASG